ncbi:hypothetical protein F2Q69_00037435 [Brassica cretica]|uniref:Uncharacterized protein n=1 Tax=Brassica cretica TaxID=69181 RepID=A0A8S9SS02_BRACR|nr:hypothetical protein F2Q69_00037435 [Brassica cretica]
MPLQDTLITHSDETHPNSLCSLFTLYIYPNTTISAQILKSIPSTMVNQTSVTIAQAPSPLFFTQVSAGPGDSKLQFRLIHFWEARKHAKGGILIGIEMLMIDEQRGSIYTLTNFFASNNKMMYGVADQKLVICITHTSIMSKLEENIEGIPSQSFRIHSFADFEANCNLRGDLHGCKALCLDAAGRVSGQTGRGHGVNFVTLSGSSLTRHVALPDHGVGLDGQSCSCLIVGWPVGLSSPTLGALHQRPVLRTKDGSTSQKIMVHLQLKDGPVMNVYLWDQAAENFWIKFDASATTPSILLVTTVNPKRLGGKLCMSSMSSSRVFLGHDVDPTKDFLNWLTANPAAVSLVNPVEVVNVETLTIREIAVFIKRQPAKIAYFDCITTIDDVKLGSE